MSASKSSKSPGSFDRRSLLVSGAGAVASVALAGASFAHNHEEDKHAVEYTPPSQPTLIETALDCVHTGDICIDHCYQTFQAGHTTLGHCVERVQELVAACSGLARLASLDTQHLAEFAAATAKVCGDCEAECRKHAGHHKPCGDCADSCKACIKECKKLMA